MIIHVASINPVKVEAVKEVLREYTMFSIYEVIGVETDSGVSPQPKSLEETIQGAINRAGAVFNTCDYSFGIESGLMAVSQSKTGKMDFCACAIYDGKEFHLGLSCAFEFPIKVTSLIHKEGIDANEAFYRCGLTSDRKIGSSQGAIGLLTKGRISRKEYTSQSIRMALIHLENKDLY
ncbi:inosine/xanthosine triphosphatase [Candidatus Pacearchaeota archaeon CG10_big_fil_rev_8_21_14_0_10_32_14]|nr:MAG: inosine/xanthosine triphosphatase [Candidatus Pacearchaeota archaeon CG10_big_fil_rev_8_21_14_0_10_32_14]